jgi:hypothetical protein
MQSPVIAIDAEVFDGDFPVGPQYDQDRAHGST